MSVQFIANDKVIIGLPYKSYMNKIGLVREIRKMGPDVKIFAPKSISINKSIIKFILRWCKSKPRYSLSRLVCCKEYQAFIVDLIHAACFLRVDGLVKDLENFIVRYLKKNNTELIKFFTCPNYELKVV